MLTLVVGYEQVTKPGVIDFTIACLSRKGAALQITRQAQGLVDWKVSLIGPKNDKSVEQTSTDYKSAEQQLALIGDWFHCRQGGSWFYYGLWPLILL